MQTSQEPAMKPAAARFSDVSLPEGPASLPDTTSYANQRTPCFGIEPTISGAMPRYKPAKSKIEKSRKNERL